MDLRKFGLALLSKSLWRDVMGNNISSNAIRLKYMGNRHISFWFRYKSLGPSRGSAIWRSFHKIHCFLFKNLVWNFQTGNNILIGLDLMLGGEEVSPIPPQLLHILHQKGIFYWAQAIDEWQGAIPSWKSANVLGLNGLLASQWNNII